MDDGICHVIARRLQSHINTHNKKQTPTYTDEHIETPTKTHIQTDTHPANTAKCVRKGFIQIVHSLVGRDGVSEKANKNEQYFRGMGWGGG